MKVLILGAKGSLGKELAKVYRDLEPFCWDREDLDITDQLVVAKKIGELKPDVVYNCAAYNLVDKAEDEGRTAAENVNGYAVGYLAKACEETGAVLVHYSTNYVFDGSKKEGYNEDDSPNPISAYGRSKLMGEMELQKNMDKFYLIRTAMLYGGNSSHGKESFPEIMLKKGKAGEPLRVISGEFGNPTFVKDLAEATKALVEMQKSYGTYHLVNTGIASWYDWALEIFRIKNMQIDVVPIFSDEFKRPAQRPRYGVLNNTKFIELRPWTEALKEHLI